MIQKVEAGAADWSAIRVGRKRGVFLTGVQHARDTVVVYPDRRVAICPVRYADAADYRNRVADVAGGCRIVGKHIGLTKTLALIRRAQARFQIDLA